MCPKNENPRRASTLPGARKTWTSHHYNYPERFGLAPLLPPGVAFIHGQYSGRL